MKENKPGRGNSRRIKRLAELPGDISGVVIVITIAFVIVNMLLRKILKLPISGFYDITGILGIIFYSFAIVYAAVKGAHVSVRFVYSRLPKRVQRVLKKFNGVIIAVTSLLIAYASANTIWTTMLKSDVTTDLKIPLNAFRLFIVLSFLLLTVVVCLGYDISGGDEKDEDKDKKEGEV